MANVVITFSSKLPPSDPHDLPVLIVGQSKKLARITYADVAHKLQPRVSEEVFNAGVKGLHPSPTDTCALYMNCATVAALPNKCSRHNTPSSSHALTKLIRGFSSANNLCIIVVCLRSDVFASACAIARAFPTFSRKTSHPVGKETTISVQFLFVGGRVEELTTDDINCLQSAASSIQLAARIVDTPCNEMNVDGFLDEVKKVGAELGIVPEIIRDKDLKNRGFGGIYNVGMGADCPPALAILSYTPETAQKTIAWVGKGIVYDTGGLCIKAKTSMIGMKRDCGGAAGILGAFRTAVRMGFKDNLHAVFCLAENSVSNVAYRPDDIIKMYSGRTVEVNNTDAEGRLVVADGVVYAQKDLKADVILDMCTLTGAQGTATGKFHAAVITNHEDWERTAVNAGRVTGDLAHPLPYCPELHFSEFNSTLADMKNSVADRSNAQCSCAGLFIMSHLGFDFPGVWIHVDMAYPVHNGERATGYGVALLLGMFGHSSENALLQSISPEVHQIENGAEEGNASKKIRLD